MQYSRVVTPQRDLLRAVLVQHVLVQAIHVALESLHLHREDARVVSEGGFAADHNRREGPWRPAPAGIARGPVDVHVYADASHCDKGTAITGCKSVTGIVVSCHR